MAVAAIIPDYIGEKLDRVENFHGNQVVYVGWDHHLFFCAPVEFATPPDTLFGKLVDEMISGAYSAHPEYVPAGGGGVMTVLENTAGQGATIGRSFEELAAITAQLDDPACIGYCFDTAHGLASGYELRTPQGYKATWAQLDDLLGLENLRCFHLNDSKHDLGQRRDRHQHIGEGFVGLEAFRMLVNDPLFVDLPMLLETPKGPDMHQDVENMARLKNLMS